MLEKNVDLLDRIGARGGIERVVGAVTRAGTEIAADLVGARLGIINMVQADDASDVHVDHHVALGEHLRGCAAGFGICPNSSLC